MPAPIIAPSILSADFAALGDEAARMRRFGADWLHVDVMDGNYVKNITLGPCVVKSLRKATDMYLDCHLMVTDPAPWLEPFAAAGAQGFTFHLETLCESPYAFDRPYAAPTDAEVDAVIALARRAAALGLKPGLAVRPQTPFESYRKALASGEFQLLLAMTVEPGFGGQKFMPAVMEKVAQTRQAFPDLHIQVDGGLSPKTVSQASQAGANVIVAGSAIFGAEHPEAVIADLRAQCIAAADS